MASANHRAAVPPNWPAIAAASALIVGGAAALAGGVSERQAALYVVGGAIGLTLYHAVFGFAAAWRAALTKGRGDGLRAQMVMLALATAAFLPAGVSVAAGAFLFGIGMQLGGACASGSLYAVGGGNARMLVTLAAFVAGSTIGTLHAPWWYGLPALAPISLVDRLGLAPALVLQLGLLAMIYAASRARERHGRRAAPGRTAGGAGPMRLLRGPWPLVWGAVALAALNVATLAIAGHPWSITFAFALWGAKLLAAAGADVAGWTYWTWPYPAQALRAGLFADTTSVMDFGIVVGAFLAAGLAGRFSPGPRIRPGPFLAALIGGLLLGYGARLAYGCNIGAMFSGIASGSPHGWLWLAAGLLGNHAGVRLRPRFGLAA